MSDFLDDHDHDGAAGDLELDERIDQAIWQTDNVRLTTVGVDIGSATSHLMFSAVHLRRVAERFSSRFEVVERQVLHRSPVVLTPYRPDGLIDAEQLATFIARAYADAGIGREGVDTGAVILTGVALERANARAIAELFAADGGRFVCASAGHNLEAVLAAHGSGAVARSRDAEPILNVDIGGGTTKLALCVDGAVRATAAFEAGARLVVRDPTGHVIRIEHAGAELAGAIGLELRLGFLLTDDDAQRLADALADRIIRAIRGDPEVALLAGGLPASPPPAALSLSGGVAELVGAPSVEGFGDLGALLAASLDRRLPLLGLPVVPSVERLRATVIGASQFTAQLSGNTIHLSGALTLPMRNVPVVRAGSGTSIVDDVAAGVAMIDRAESDEPVAIAIRWRDEVTFERLAQMASGLWAAHASSPRREGPLVVVMDEDLGASLGGLLLEEADGASPTIVIDGLELSDFDYVDIGELVRPAMTVPVVIKSLIFPEDERSRMYRARLRIGDERA